MNTLSAQKILDLLTQTQKFINKSKEIAQIKEKEKIAELAAMAGENYQENFLKNYEKFLSLLQNEEIFFTKSDEGQEITSLLGMETLIPTGENLEEIGDLIKKNTALFLKKIPVTNHYSSNKIELAQFTEVMTNLKNLLQAKENFFKLSLHINTLKFNEKFLNTPILTYTEQNELTEKKEVIESLIQNEKTITLFSSKKAQGKNPLQKNALISLSPHKKIPLAPYEIALSANINLLKFINKEKTDFDYEKLSEKSRDALQLMDNLIDVIPYPLNQIMEKSLNERKIAFNIANLMESLEQILPKITFEEVFNILEKLLAYLFEELFRKSRELAIFRGSFPSITDSFFAKKNIEIRNASLLHISIDDLECFSLEQQIEIGSIIEKNSNSSHLCLNLKNNEIEKLDDILKSIEESDIQAISLKKI